MAVAICPRHNEERRLDSTGHSYCRSCNREYMRKRRGLKPDKTPARRNCANPECGKEFVAHPRNRRYCAEACERRVRVIRLSERSKARRLPVAPLIQYALDHEIPFLPEGTDGTVGFFQADEYAVKHLKTHPALIYGQAWWRAAAA